MKDRFSWSECQTQNGNHTGAARQVMEALTDEPQSIDALASATGLKPKKVKNALYGMMGAYGRGGVIGQKCEDGVWRYARYRARPARRQNSAGSGRIAGPIVIGRGSRWGASLV